MFEFLKKKELFLISQLEEENEILKNEVSSLSKKLDLYISENNLLSKYKDVLDVETFIDKLTVEKTRLLVEEADLNEKINTLTLQIDSLNNSLRDLQEEYEVIDDYKVYNPLFSKRYETSEKLYLLLEDLKRREKSLIKKRTAILYKNNYWDNYEKFSSLDYVIKVLISSLNLEYNNLIASVKWDNVLKYEERMINLFNKHNNFLVKIGLGVSKVFLNLKIKELKVTHEYALMKYEEEEERKRINEMIKEENKAIREYEVLKNKIEKEETIYQNTLEKIKKKLLLSSGVDKLVYEEQIKDLEEKITKLEEEKERAISLAQQTKKGYVYIISNVGSFGENVYKIGMTRRLDPLDRVKELGDASVPFSFDIHALISSDDAPTLEYSLHKKFENKRLNLINNRKEFFNVNLDEIENECMNLGCKFTLTKAAKADEYFESLARRNNIASLK